MRRQDHWLHLADTMNMSRSTVVAACTFLNMRRAPTWVALQLQIPLRDVFAIKEAAAPFLRQIVEEQA